MSNTPPPWLKPVVDYAPLLVFLGGYAKFGLMTATAALLATTAAVLVLAYVMTRRIAVVPLVTAVIAGVFGGLTLWLNDETFIKMKPTIVYALFALVLAGGLMAGRPLLKTVLGEAFAMDDLGWRRLSLRFALFFLVMALANEVARHVLSTDMWVLWKVPGSLIVTFAFMLFQAPFVRRHRLPAGE